MLSQKKIAAQRKETLPLCNTATITLSGGEFDQPLKAEIFEAGQVAGIEHTRVDHLFRKFGSNTREIIAIYNRIKSAESDKALLIAQLIYCMENEMCRTPADFIVRRTGKMYFNISEARSSRHIVLNYMKNFLGWKEEEYEQMKKKTWKKHSWNRILERLNLS